MKKNRQLIMEKNLMEIIYYQFHAHLTWSDRVGSRKSFDSNTGVSAATCVLESLSGMKIDKNNKNNN
jgi:hypothetical protein